MSNSHIRVINSSDKLKGVSCKCNILIGKISLFSIPYMVNCFSYQFCMNICYSSMCMMLSNDDCFSTDISTSVYWSWQFNGSSGTTQANKCLTIWITQWTEIPRPVYFNNSMYSDVFLCCSPKLPSQKYSSQYISNMSMHLAMHDFMRWGYISGKLKHVQKFMFASW